MQSEKHEKVNKICNECGFSEPSVLFTEDVENLSKGYKINKPLSGLLVYRLIMSLAERWSSKLPQLPSKLRISANCLFFGFIY